MKQVISPRVTFSSHRFRCRSATTHGHHGRSVFVGARPGFTLVELLVVIVIIAALAMLTFLGFRSTRAAADRAKVSNVMRQMQMANQSYAADHQGLYVPIQSIDENNSRVSAWHDNSSFIAYLTGDTRALDRGETTVQAPISMLDPIAVRAKGRLWDRVFASYGYNTHRMPMNRNRDGKTQDKCFRVLQVTDPTRTAAFVTATDWVLKYTGRLNWESSPEEGKSTDGKMAFRHGGRAIVVYYDGHIGFVTPHDLKEFDKQGGSNHPFWKADF